MRDYLGWKYGYNKENGDFIIIPSKKYDIPKTFFKYYALNDNSVDALTNMYIYASHPYLLNDPFDCDGELAKIEDYVSAKAIWENLFDNVKMIYNNDADLFKYTTECFSTLMFAKYGILSLTTTCENTIMWSSYANNNGFCLEFDVRNFPFKHIGPFPIHYVEMIEQGSSLNYNVQELVLIQSNVKNNCWQYENEWRLLVMPPEGFDMKTFGKYSERLNQFPNLHDRKFRYPIKALKSIILGVDFFKEPCERQQIINQIPYELHICYQKVCHETKILDFLDRLSKNDISAPIRLIVKTGLTYKIIPIVVSKINYLTYRITEIVY